jgi:hypothetical protein
MMLVCTDPEVNPAEFENMGPVEPWVEEMDGQGVRRSGSRLVEYLVVGGLAAQGYGATWVTKDLDCVVRQQRENLDRLANARRELGARLRVGGLSDDEAKLLPFQLDGASLAGGQMWTLRTDAGDLDMLANIPGKGGTRLDYEALAERAGVVQLESLTILVASLDDVEPAIPPGPNRRRRRRDGVPSPDRTERQEDRRARRPPSCVRGPPVGRLDERARYRRLRDTRHRLHSAG